MINNIIEKIEATMKEAKYKVAVSYNGTEYTFGELDHFTYKIAVYLQSQGIIAEDIVAIYMERSWLSVCATIGIMRAGAAFLPIDKKTPINRIKKILEISKAKLVLCDTDFKLFDNINIVDIISKDYGNKVLARASINDNTLAYVIFTSGTTGEPKGVMIEHGGLCNHISEKIRVLELDEESIVAHNASISFDISIWQLLAPICCGGKIVVFSENSIIQISQFLKILNQERVTILEVVPTYLSIIINECRKGIVHNSLKYIISTGEELSKVLADRWFAVFPDIPIVNAYGPTEASDDIAHCIITKTDGYTCIPIGVPINNANFSINYKNELCEKGELWVRGICVGRGYIGNEEETRKFFSFDKTTGERIYKTGDLVSKSADGQYYYHGRIDKQIKLHGNRIEIKEIENFILNFSGINEVVVIYNQKKGELCAVFTSEEIIDIEQLKIYLKDRIPHYMLPAFFVQVAELSVDINGKTNYRELMKKVNHKNNNVIEQNEEIVCNLIKNIIGDIEFPEDESWKDDLSVIGLDSLAVIQLIVSIEEKFEFEFDEKYLQPEVVYNFHEICKCIAEHKNKKLL